MYQNHSQVGRTRVNRLRESIKTKKTHVQLKKDNITGLDKLFKIQDEIFKEGLDADEYNDYILDKIQNKMYYYRGLSDEKIEKLNKRYGDMVEKENNNYTVIGKNKEISRKRRSDFKNKKRYMVDDKKRELIDSLLKEMKRTTSIGVLKNTDNMSTDPSKWNNTKNLLFSGGRYLESHDHKWVDIYRKLSSNFSPHLFDLHSTSSLNQFVFDC